MQKHLYNSMHLLILVMNPAGLDSHREQASRYVKILNQKGLLLLCFPESKWLMYIEHLLLMLKHSD